MKAKYRHAAFDPELGLVAGLSVRDSVKTLIAEGWFDKATSVVIAVSNNNAVDWRSQGSTYEAMTLGHFLSISLDDQFKRS